jgi:aspartate/methionine/tyrosine aminotransferase
VPRNRRDQSGAGLPDFEEPGELIAAAQRALAAHPNQYPPMRGLPVLREAVAGLYGVEAGEVIVTSGATEALASDPGAGAAGRRGDLHPAAI